MGRSGSPRDIAGSERVAQARATVVMCGVLVRQIGRYGRLAGSPRTRPAGVGHNAPNDQRSDRGPTLTVEALLVCRRVVMGAPIHGTVEPGFEGVADSFVRGLEKANWARPSLRTSTAARSWNCGAAGGRPTHT